MGANCSRVTLVAQSDPNILPVSLVRLTFHRDMLDSLWDTRRKERSNLIGPTMCYVGTR